MRVKSTLVSHICTLWILILLGLWLWSACHSQLALVNMDVMENPPPVPVRRQKYWRSHLYTWYHALSSGQRGRAAQHLKFAKSQACHLPKLNLFNIGQGGSAIDSSLIVEYKAQLLTTTPTKVTYGTRSKPLSESIQSYTCHKLLMYRPSCC